ncbi:ATP-binding cassette, subfamily F, member 3 [Salinibacillus kushneri]|uniref:ATP-binding cassette, subfamily F, member 3 n=1 Tax=Salinibacillus kushneri TaxID=237682 RepID=A0A1I0J4T2_9BACI|nr:ABC-F family ATP-binding cassette domain-containing protein [Salinibacillus kushneri]SEU04858.1 ATP-binding cassette, subfamily F, member 3 [Salinibacillus kushneri]
MILMQLNNIEKYFGADLILSNIKLEVHSQDRIAIVGRNGAGKSTLLKIMSGEYSYDNGEMIRPRDTTIGYLAQNTGLESSLTIWEEMEQVFSELKKREKELRQLEEKMADPNLMEDHSAYEELLKDYDVKQEEFRRLGGFEYEADIKAVLNGLKFSNVNASINELSGGQKTRLALGKLLLAKPDILILDEPTNHLDIETLNWLEQYLQNYHGAVVIVSHDRYFLDKTVTVVYEVSFQTSKKYTGNYSDYLVQKAQDYERNLKQYEKQQAEVKKLEEFIQKNIVRASTTKRAQSRRKRLEKMEVMDKPKLDNQSAKFSFDIERQSGNDVLKLENLSFRYQSQQANIFQNVNLSIHREDRIGLVGPNGIGKSTLLKTIVGQLAPYQGHIDYGTNVQIGYYDQEQTNLSSNKTVLNELWDEYPLKPEKEIRTVLGNFLFSGDDVLKTIPSLSGGEKARLVLAKLMLQKANFLIMDEPTNHLDLDSKEVLESALIDFPGTILFVSHDRYFINRIATKIVEMSKEGTNLYLGDYDYYLSKKQEEKELEELNATQDNQVNPPEEKSQFYQTKAEKREIRKLERRVEEIENQIQTIEETIEGNEQNMVQPEFLNDHEKLQELTNENEQLAVKLDQLLEEWTNLQEQLADI